MKKEAVLEGKSTWAALIRLMGRGLHIPNELSHFPEVKLACLWRQRATALKRFTIPPVPAR